MTYPPKWSLIIEDVHGTWVFVIMRGRSKEGTGSADDFDTCLEMATECYWDCRKYRREMPKP